jgi:hypothetical protein
MGTGVIRAHQLFKPGDRHVVQAAAYFLEAADRLVFYLVVPANQRAFAKQQVRPREGRKSVAAKRVLPRAQTMTTDSVRDVEDR